MCPSYGLSTLILPPMYHFALFIYMFQYLALFTYIYPHLALFAPIWSYLPLIALMSPYMPYTPYIYILLVRLHPCVQNFKAIRKLIMENHSSSP